MDTYAIWNDETICCESEIEEYLAFISDDYTLVSAPTQEEAIQSFRKAFDPIN